MIIGAILTYELNGIIWAEENNVDVTRFHTYFNMYPHVFVFTFTTDA